jgi:hypothetical protein
MHGRGLVIAIALILGGITSCQGEGGGCLPVEVPAVTESAAARATSCDLAIEVEGLEYGRWDGCGFVRRSFLGPIVARSAQGSGDSYIARLIARIPRAEAIAVRGDLHWYFFANRELLDRYRSAADALARVTTVCPLQ